MKLKGKKEGSMKPQEERRKKKEGSCRCLLIVTHPDCVKGKGGCGGKKKEEGRDGIFCVVFRRGGKKKNHLIPYFLHRKDV